MINKNMQEFQRLYPKFKMRQQQIPQNLRWKLLLIAQKVYRTHLKPIELTLNQQQQIQQLINLDSNTLAIFFNVMVKSLLIQKKNQEKQCKIKYPGMFQMWKSCRLNLTGKHLIVINEKILHKYQLNLIDIFNCRKNKYSFDLFFKNHLLICVKFTSHENFVEFLTHLESSIQFSKEGRLNQSLPFKMEEKQQQNIRQIQLKETENQDNSPTLIKQIDAIFPLERKSSQISQQKPQGYQTIEENENLSICLKQGEPRLYVSLLMTTQCQLQKVVNFYIQQKQWNGFINVQEIKQKDSNLFEIYRTFKKESIIQTEKSIFTKLKVICSRNSANLTEQSIHDDQQGKNEKVQCSIKTFTKFYRCLGGTKIIIDTDFRTKGYNTLKYSINMLTKLYSDLKFFQNSFKISQLQKNKVKNILSPVLTSMLQMRQSRRARISSKGDRMVNQSQIERLQIKGQKEFGENANTNDTLQLNPINCEQKQSENKFLKIKPNSPLDKPSLQYIESIGNNEHERYYLSYRFNQNILSKYEEYIPSYCLSQMIKKGNEYRITKDNELVYINQDVLNGQKDSLKFIIKQIGANILTGKSVLNVSMPVDIFQSRSLLERNACAFGQVPDYLLPVADADPLTQMKNVLTCIATLPILELLMQKPFNPILGQTFQAYIKGIPIYYEQISHHPPISAYYMTCPQFTMHGQLAAFADVSINSAVGGNQGVTHIIFRNGTHFQCYFYPCEISGLIFGTRTFRAYGKGYILEKKSNLFAQMSVQKAKKGLYEQGEDKLSPADLIGGIFKVKQEFMDEIVSQSSLRKFSGLSKKQVQNKVADIRGIWFEKIKINGEVINKNITIYPLEYPKILLPSDSNYREDILYHKISDLAQSQKMKEFLQVKQRSDRKLRQKQAKISKKRS